MNRNRRKDLGALVDRLTALNLDEVMAELSSINDDLESIMDEEREYFDNMPENMQSGDKGSAAEEAINSMESAKELLDSIVSALEESADIIRSIDDARGQ